MITLQDLNNLKTSFESNIDKKLDEKLKPIHKKLNKLQKEIDLIAKSHDKDITQTMIRVDRIEEHLSLTPVTIY